MKFIVFLILSFFALSFTAQTIHGLTITPSSSVSSGSINILADFTYSGNCSFGLVGTHTAVTGNTLLVMPFYCGYGDTTICHRIDTFKIASLPAGAYHLKVEFHQASICPVSNFDITLASKDTAFTVAPVTNLQDRTVSQIKVSIHFNAPDNRLLVTLIGADDSKKYTLMLFSLTGELISHVQLSPGSNALPLQVPTAIYLARIFQDGIDVHQNKILVEH